MRLVFSRIVLKLVFIFSAVLLIISAIGTISDFSYRSHLDSDTNSEEMLYTGIDKSFDKYGANSTFVKEAVAIYSEGMIFSWPDKLARIPLTDNWVLHFYHI